MWVTENLAIKVKDIVKERDLAPNYRHWKGKQHGASNLASSAHHHLSPTALHHSMVKS